MLRSCFVHLVTGRKRAIRPCLRNSSFLKLVLFSLVFLIPVSCWEERAWKETPRTPRQKNSQPSARSDSSRVEFRVNDYDSFIFSIRSFLVV